MLFFRTRTGILHGKDRNFLKVLVTGATGFIGKRLLPVLRAQNHSLRLLVRDPERAKGLVAPQTELFRGDLESPSCFPAALESVDAVIHMAGLVSAVGRKDFSRVNGEATRRLALAAAAQSGEPPRFVYVSSQAAAGPNLPGRTRVEEDLPSPVSHYGSSKREGELALESLPISKLPWTILRPPAVYGPGDIALFPFFQMAAKGTVILPARAAMRFSLIHVDDLCAGIAAALTSPRAIGRHYFLAGEEQPTVREVLLAMGEAFGKKPKILALPGAIVWPMSWISDVAAFLRRRPSFFSSDKMREMRASEWLCSAQRASAEFGFRQRIALTQGLTQTAAWYKSEGWIQ